MNTDKTEQTLANTLNSYAEKKPARFHMPGHKGISLDSVFKAVYPLDVTELSVTDNLHQPSGALKKLQQRFANLYSAKASFLLVNGSTAGNIAVSLSLGIGKRVLLGRDCHKSVLSGIALAGHEAVSIFPDAAKGIITPEAVEDAFINTDEPFDAVFLTSPNYYGKVCDIKRIAEIVHAHGALLFIDAAHGAHFPFSKLLPENPFQTDAWVVSCHKTLNSMTQTAVLNLGYSCPIEISKLQDMLSLVQSSSPSFVLMRSLEQVLESPMDWDKHCDRLIAFRKRLMNINGLKIDGTSKKTFSVQKETIDFDITRLVISVDGINGFSLAEQLEEKGICVEMSDAKSIVLITSPNDPNEWYERLYAALDELSARSCINIIGNTMASETENSEASDSMLNAFDFDFPHIQKTSVRAAMLGDSQDVPFSDAQGRICARAVGIYPPGIAILFPGEEIGKAALQTMIRLKAMGAKLFGTENGMLSVLDYEPAAERRENNEGGKE